MGDLRPEAVFSELWKSIISLRGHQSFLGPQNMKNSIDLCGCIFFINLSLEHLKSLEAKKSVYNFGKQKSPFFFSIHVGNCYMNWHEFQHVYVWRINVQVSYPYTIEKSDNVLSLWHHLLAFIFFHNLSNLLWHIVILSMKSWENPKWMMF